jgi:2-phosphosulfolactate phosphatase
MSLQIERVYRPHAGEAQGIVIVIDVIRAFSVAGYAFAGGCQGLWLVRTVAEALALRERESTALLIGEVGGRLIDGFNLNNSPSLMAQASVKDRLLIQRTGAGTQGAVSVRQAQTILICALTNAQATAHYARSLADSTGQPITFHPTASVADQTARNEDDICADYLQALLEERDDAEKNLQQDIVYLRNSDRFDEWRSTSSDFPINDIPAVFDVNRFHFAMVGTAQKWHDIDYVEVKRVEDPLNVKSV